MGPYLSGEKIFVLGECELTVSHLDNVLSTQFNWIGSSRTLLKKNSVDFFDCCGIL